MVISLCSGVEKYNWNWNTSMLLRYLCSSCNSWKTSAQLKVSDHGKALSAPDFHFPYFEILSPIIISLGLMYGAEFPCSAKPRNTIGFIALWGTGWISWKNLYSCPKIEAVEYGRCDCYRHLLVYVYVRKHGKVVVHNASEISGST